MQMLSTEIGDNIRTGKRARNFHQSNSNIIHKPQEVIPMLYISSKAPFLWAPVRKRTLFRAKKISLVLIYAWLFMNLDPGYNHRVVKAMMMSRAQSRYPWFSPLRGRRDNITPGNSLSTIETIALIQAINSNRGPLDLNINQSPLPIRQLDTQRQQLATNLERQLAPPLPAAVILAAVAAFFTAVASGLAPVAAVAAAASAAAAALLAIVVSLMKMKNKNDGKGKGGKGKPLIKKLVIKKTVLPFVIPVVVNTKKEEEKYYKVYKKKPEHYHESKKHYKKMDKPIDKIDKPSLDPSMNQIKYLLDEQNKLQSMVDKIINVTENDKTSTKSIEADGITLDRRMGVKKSLTRQKLHPRTSGRS